MKSHSRNLDKRSENLLQAEITAGWRGELRKRIDEVRSGALEFLDFAEFHRQIRAQLIARRK